MGLNLTGGQVLRQLAGQAESMAPPQTRASPQPWRDFTLHRAIRRIAGAANPS